MIFGWRFWSFNVSFFVLFSTMRRRMLGRYSNSPPKHAPMAKAKMRGLTGRFTSSSWLRLISTGICYVKQTINQLIDSFAPRRIHKPPRIWNEPDVNVSSARGERYTLRFSSSLKYCLFIWACFLWGVFFFGFLTVVKNLVVNRLSHISVQRGSGEERKSIKSNTAFIYFYSP